VLQVQKNIAALRAKLPNFVCKEQIDMQEVADGKVVKTGQHVSRWLRFGGAREKVIADLPNLAKIFLLPRMESR